MHDVRGPHDPAPERLPEALMAEAHPEHWSSPAKRPNDLIREPGVVRGARTGRDQDGIRLDLHDLINRAGVVPMDDGICSQFAQVLDEVVDE